ncbi:MAG: glycosyltransferase family 4 protein [Oligosphaeraceae bacterium]
MKVDSPHIDVLHVTEACGGGVSRHIRLIVPELQASGVRCAVCGFGQRVEENFLNDLTLFAQAGIQTEFWPFNHGNALGVAAFILHLRRLLRDWRPAIVHAHATLAGLACRVARDALPGVRVVYSPHAFALHPSLPWHIRTSIRHLETWAADRTDAYAFVGRSEIEDANAIRLPANKFHLIENGLPLSYPDKLYTREDARKALNLPRDGRFAVIPCRLVRQKGLDQVLYAITRLGPECSDIQFMFCGVGPERDALLTLAGQLGIASRTHFPGTIDRLDVLLPAFDMAILPSLYEGLSYVLLESLAAGIPLIVSDILANVPRPELRDILNTFTVGDCDELAVQIALVAGDPQRTQARASLGAAYMRSNFRLASQIQKLSNLYRFLQ